jgi:adenylate kinase
VAQERESKELIRVVLLGAPGCGKGTQGEKLRTKYNVPQISTGDMLRTAISGGTSVGEKAKTYVTAGALVPDGVILELVEERLGRPDAAEGFILDGFPRSIPQADGLGVLLLRQGLSLDRVLKLDVSKKTLIERMTSRRVCPGCGDLYNMATRPPATAGRCDRCGTSLAQRDDDTEVTVRRRLNVYESSTAPLIDYYDGRRLLSIINGEGTPEEVSARILSALERKANG